MFFHKRKTLPLINLSINNAKVENVIKYNYLGFLLDECLSWNAHIEMIGIKISKAIGIISHLKLIYPQRILFTLYNSLIISHMLYSRVGASVCDTHLEAFFKRSFLALLRSLVTTFACSHCQSVSHGVGSRSFRPPSWIF